MDFQSIALIIITCFLFILTLSVFIRKESPQGHYFFALSMLFIGAWTLASIINHNSSSILLVTLFTRLSYSASLLGITFLLLFSMSFAQERKIPIKKVAILASLTGFLIFLIHFTNLIIGEAYIRTPQRPEAAILGNYFLLFGIITASYLLLIIKNFITSLRSSTGIINDQVKYILIGTSFSIFLGILFGLVLQIIGLRNVHHFAPYTPIIAIAFIYYSIFKHRFLSLKLFVSKLILILVLSLLAYITFYLIAGFDIKVFKGIYTESAYIYGAAFALLFILIIKTILDKFSAKYINPILNYEAVNLEFNRRIGDKLDKKEIAKLFTKILMNRLVFSKIIIIYLDEVGQKVTPRIILNNHQDAVFYETEERIINSFPLGLLKEVLDHKFKIFVTEELKLEHDQIQEGTNVQKLLSYLEANKLEIVAPLLFNKKALGYVFIGSKLSGSAYSIQDIQLIESLSLSLSFALQRSILYYQVKSFADTLQTEVNEATKELRQKYQQERDIIGILGHELRTPLTIAKSNLDYLITKIKTNKVSDIDYILKKVETAYDSIESETRVVETALSTSHVDNNKIDIILSPVDIIQVIEYGFEAHRKQAADKGLHLIFEKPLKKIPKIITDQTKLQEIIINLISNAVKYTTKGYIKVFIKKEPGNLLIGVEDSGEGIPKEEISRLGQKFYRVQQYTSNSYTVRPGGTGLGLYVAKAYLKAMGGEFRVSSEVGKGSTFTAVIPYKVAPSSTVSQKLSQHQKDVDMFSQLGLKR